MPRTYNKIHYGLDDAAEVTTTTAIAQGAEERCYEADEALHLTGAPSTMPSLTPSETGEEGAGPLVAWSHPPAIATNDEDTCYLWQGAGEPAGMRLRAATLATSAPEAAQRPPSAAVPMRPGPASQLEKTQLCVHPMQKGHCPYLATCKFAHSTGELRIPPLAFPYAKTDHPRAGNYNWRFYKYLEWEAANGEVSKDDSRLHYISITSHRRIIEDLCEKYYKGKGGKG